MTRTQIEIASGILLVLITATVLLFYGFNEEERMTAFAQSQQAEMIEVGAELFEAQCSRCHGTQGLGIEGLCPPLNDRYFFDQRLAEVGWSGTHEDYIIATAAGGRLASTRPETYPGNGTPAMPAFSEQYGGPLRDDQIRAIAVFIMNWESTAGAVQAAQTPSGPPVGTDINQTLPEGQAEAGEALAASLGCTACHVSSPTGPAWMAGEEPGIGARAAGRITQAGYTGNAENAQEYLFEAIVAPDAHLVEGYTDLMPKTYSQSLTAQDVADLIAYLETFK